MDRDTGAGVPSPTEPRGEPELTNQEIGQGCVGLAGGVVFAVAGLVLLGMLIHFQLVYGHGRPVGATVLPRASADAPTSVALGAPYAGTVATIDFADTTVVGLEPGRHLSVLVDPEHPTHALMPYILSWYAWTAVVVVPALASWTAVSSGRSLGWWGRDRRR